MYVCRSVWPTLEDPTTAPTEAAFGSSSVPKGPLPLQSPPLINLTAKRRLPYDSCVSLVGARLTAKHWEKEVARKEYKVWTTVHLQVYGSISTQICCIEHVPEFGSNQMAVITGVKFSSGLWEEVIGLGNAAHCKHLEYSLREPRYKLIFNQVAW